MNICYDNLLREQVGLSACCMCIIKFRLLYYITLYIFIQFMNMSINLISHSISHAPPNIQASLMIFESHVHHRRHIIE